MKGQVPTGPAVNFDKKLAECRVLIESGNLADAERELREYLRRSPNSGYGHFLLGYVLFRQTHARESLAEYTEGAKYRRPTAFDLRVVGSDYVLLSSFSDADKWFSKAVEWEPQNVLGWYYLGRTKYNENRFEEAIRAFQQCLKLEPRNVKASDNLGLAYQGLGRMEEAAVAYRNAMDWESESPGNPEPFINMGTLLIEQEKPREAVSFLKKALEIAPLDAKAHQEIGKAYSNLDQPAVAESELLEAVKLAPDNARVHYVLGQLYRKQGENEKAKEQFARFSELNGAHSTPENIDSYPLERR